MSTAIEWTDVTDNIIVVKDGGWWCRMISEGCVNCYAAQLNQSDYFGGNHLPYTGNPPELMLRTEMIDSWARQTKPKKHFVASMTDIFGDWVPIDWIFRFLDGMVAAPNQTFQLLTKRADILKSSVALYCQARGLKRLPANIWAGVSVENQKRGDERIPLLLETLATVRFLSVEPLLGKVELKHEWLIDGSCFWPPRFGKHHETINWVIVGGESGPRSRPCNIEWIRGIVAQCKAAGVPCFVKQLGAKPEGWCAANLASGDVGDPVECDIYESGESVGAICGARCAFLKHKKGGDPAEWPADLRIRQFPLVATVAGASK